MKSIDCEIWSSHRVEQHSSKYNFWNPTLKNRYDDFEGSKSQISAFTPFAVNIERDQQAKNLVIKLPNLKIIEKPRK